MSKSVFYRFLFLFFSFTFFGLRFTYAASTGEFVVVGNMATSHSNHTETLLPDGKVIIIGGANNRQASAEIFNPTTGLFINTTGKMIRLRAMHTATPIKTGQLAGKG